MAVQFDGPVRINGTTLHARLDGPANAPLVAMLRSSSTAQRGQNYPSRTITLSAPYAAGGGVEAVSRVIADGLGARLGQKIIIENVTGAGGVIRTQRAALARPDGYTLLFAVESTMAVAKLVQPSIVQYDSQKDFEPINLTQIRYETSC